MNSNAYWPEPEYEPVSPQQLTGSIPCQGNSPKIKEFPWPDPPQKRMKFMETIQTPPFQSSDLLALNSTITHAPRGSVRPGSSFLQKTKLCTRFEAGTCTFNANCNFAHGLEELRQPLPRGSNLGGSLLRPVKVKQCKFLTEANCPYKGRCTFLHQGEQAQGQGQGPIVNGGAPMQRTPFWKTKLCIMWRAGQTCNFGDKCRYAHGQAELQQPGGTFHGQSEFEVMSSTKPSNNFVEPENNFTASYSNLTGFGVMNKPAAYVPEGNVLVPGFISTEASMPPNNTYGEIMANTYQNPQEVGAVTSPYNRYTSRNELETSGLSVRSEVNNSEMYGQVTQQESWVSHYHTNDFNSQRLEDPSSLLYSRDQMHQKDTVPFFRGTTRNDYLAEVGVEKRHDEGLDSLPSRHGDDHLHGMQGKNDYYSQGYGYDDEETEPYTWNGGV